ncbi:MAG: sigma-54-dependent Fis family transcriptional regulator [Magnetococcales bacterium]|nr:sigma-54-dependent Fis family transcriptional regulator [Magnetococcales bacterium]
MSHPKRTTPPVILVDDDEEVLFSSSVLLKTFGVTSVVTMADGRDLLPYLAKKPVGMIVLDLIMPHISGTQLLPEIVQHHPEIPVVVATASQDVETAVQCMKNGAFDYLVKPVEESRFVSAIKRALEVRSLRNQVSSLKACLLQHPGHRHEAFDGIITNSPRMEAVFQYVQALSSSTEPILITGETGVGKGVLAQAIHTVSGLAGELVSVNVAGLDETMFSDTLFGHRKGAFSGATHPREGLVSKAHGGILFLDEIGDLDKRSQVKLLRLLQEKSYYPLGSDLPRLTDAQVVVATNQDLRHRMQDGSFRQDLFFRLSAHQIDLPPLRERLEDIPLLVGHFLQEACLAMGKPTLEPPPELFTLLSSYPFPGNIRELRSLIHDAVARHRSGQIVSMKSIKNAIRANTAGLDPSASKVMNQIRSTVRATGRFPTLKEAENLIVQEALRQTEGNQGIAAMLLGVSRPALNRRLMRLKAEAKS